MLNVLHSLTTLFGDNDVDPWVINITAPPPPPPPPATGGGGRRTGSEGKERKVKGREEGIYSSEEEKKGRQVRRC